MARRDIIVLGTSAGGIEALQVVARGLPEGLPAAVFVVQHIAPTADGALPAILSRAGPLPARFAVNGEPIRRGRIYVAPPDLHMLIHRDVVHVTHGPRENRVRPAIDPLFRSAAYAHGPRVVGVILTGLLDDGSAGLVAIKERGGVAVVQDPETAMFPSMPRNALENVPVDMRLALEDIPQALADLVDGPAGEGANPSDSDDMGKEIAEAQLDPALMSNSQHPGRPSSFSCPDCQGVLYELSEGGMLRYRCRVGHAYSPDSLRASQDEALENALWSALRALEEKIDLARRLERRAQDRSLPIAAARFAARATEAEEHAEKIRRVLAESQTLPDR